MKKCRMAIALAVVSMSTHAVLADVRADQRTRVEFAGMLGKMMGLFGGKAARDGVTSTIAVKGDRKATMNDTTGQIIDLGEEKVYDLDLKKKTYKVMTFADLRRRFEEAQKKAEESIEKAKAKAKESTAPTTPPAVEFDVDVKNSGERKTINGFETRESVTTITMREKGKTLAQDGGMVLTMDNWLTPKIAAMKQVADFDIRYAQKLFSGLVTGVSADQMAQVTAMYPMMKQMLGRMTTEGAKLNGTPILTTMTMDAVKSEEQIAKEAKPPSAESKSDSKTKIPTSVGGLLGGLAKKAVPKKADEDEGEKPRATFMTITTEVLKVVTDVSASDVAIPAGFKETK